MPHDKNGNLLQAGDVVNVPCTIKEITASGDTEYYNILVETTEKMGQDYPGEYPVGAYPVAITLNAKQVVKVLACLLLGLFLSALPVRSQTVTNATSGTFLTGLLNLGTTIYDATPTNLGAYAYGTYALKPHKTGGGLAIVYNVNDYVGVLAAIDYVDLFVGINGGIQLQLPLHPLANYGYPNFELTPFGVSAAGSPFQGTSNNNGLETIQSAGLKLGFGHLWGGDFGVGVLYGTRTGAGTYSGGYLNGFLGWQKGF